MERTEPTKLRRHSQQKVVKRGTWLPVEDARLREAVAKYGPRWVLVANDVETRNGDQCAKRWNENLNPELDHSPWTPEEEEQLLSLVATYGNNWKFLANSFLEPRAPLALKNRYSLLMRRLKRQGLMSKVPMPSPGAVQMPPDSISSNVSAIPSNPVDLAGLFSPTGEPNLTLDGIDDGFPTLSAPPSDVGSLAASSNPVSHGWPSAEEGFLSRATTESNTPELIWPSDALLGMSPEEMPAIPDPDWNGNEMDQTNMVPDSSPPDQLSQQDGEREATAIEYSVSCQRGKLKSLVNYLVEAAMSESADGAMEEDQVTLTLQLKS
ncbi:hypothetical protein P170DRAFT_435087 [Aspergillus steynii IBT 23096]|uniref:Uncharacterized protein n=1 Tax=Aspergillus steynii IBT 23096 TaxID=1392250 RepID=A0A2I2GKS8_9EURO|nr:uncharacterized protein P170DRAFT_435087 [Aspergillus steynii IBT 23096]PLB53457.1 hypothetical protein P170DRAFT_435087 [Aspergillus steynii IBT 23096]